MNVDLAVLTPAYLDYTFVGLEALPGPGEERFAGDMLRSPGGGAITAVGARRLGLSTALVAPLGDDLAGRFVRRELDAEGVIMPEPRGNRTPTTVVMPVAGERSMVTVDPGIRARAADLEPLSPRAVAITLEQIDIVPQDVCAFVTCGDDDARAFAGRLPQVSENRRPRALIVNRREAGVLTGAKTSTEAAARLAEVADIAAVTLGADGAVAVVDGHEMTAAGCDGVPVLDTTGAGDLFAAALAWADLLGAEPEVSLVWANLYAGLSVGSHTGAGGAVTRERLLEEGSKRGLPELPGV
jgi:sugar/nucleoside kinase (ribokinase family)